MGIKICPDCGGKVSESRDTCIHCGYIFSKPKPKKICPDCEAEVDEDVNECPECGHYFVLPAASASKQDEEPKSEEKPAKEKEQHIHNVICSSCGSGDLEQLDEFTYRCNNCSNIVKVKRPDVNVYNINSFAGDSKTADVPVYQVVRNLDEEEFTRRAVLHLASAENVSPTFLENFKADKSMVILAYITYISKEYMVDVSYSCEIGTDYEVTYYDKDGNKRTKTETRWEPFSGNANDGGVATFCAFGDETKIDALTPFFSVGTYEFEEFKETEKYPLKRRPDRSAEEDEKRHQISSLESDCKYHLPGDHNRNFRSNGRCMFGETKAFYYVPGYTLIAQSNGHEVAFSSVANQEGRIIHVFLESDVVANQGDETMPTRNKAKNQFKLTSFGTVSLLCIIMLPIFIGISLILSIIFSTGLFFIFIPFYVAALIVVSVMRNKTISKIHSNLIRRFKQRKLNACITCLANNNLSPLSDAERSEIL